MSGRSLGRVLSAARRLLAMVLAVSFLTTNTVLAAPLSHSSALPAPAADAHDQSMSAKEMQEISVPEAYGTILERFHGMKKQTVIAVQDVHVNYEVQMNFAQLMEYLSKSKWWPGLRFIGLEGAQGPVDVSHFRQYPDKDVIGWIGDLFVRTGYMSGAEYFGMVAPSPPLLLGLEMKDLYVQNLGYFMRVHKASDSAIASVQEMRELLNLFRQDVYSPQLRTLSLKQEGYDGGSVSFTDFVDYLADACKKADVRHERYENFAIIVQSLQIEKQIHMARVDVERNNLIAVLQRAMVKEDLAGLVAQTLYFRLGKITSAIFYGYLRDASIKAKIPLEKYPNLSRYIEWTGLYQKIDTRRAFFEMDQIVQDVKAKWMTTPDEKLLDRLYGRVSMLNKMLRLQMTRDDLRRYRDQRAEITGPKIVGEIQELLNRYPKPIFIHPRWTQVSEPLALVDGFYEVALQRDTVLADNLIKTMEAQKTDVSVLFTGGFHTQGITQRLKSQNVSYMVLTPRITKTPDDSVYLSIMLNKTTPVERLLSTMGTRLSPWIVGATEAIVDSDLGINTHELAKQRDAIGDALVGLFKAVKASRHGSGRVMIPVIVDGATVLEVSGGTRVENPISTYKGPDGLEFQVSVTKPPVSTLVMAASRLAGRAPVHPLEGADTVGTKTAAMESLDLSTTLTQGDLAGSLERMKGVVPGIIEDISAQIVGGQIVMKYRLLNGPVKTVTVLLYSNHREQIGGDNARILRNPTTGELQGVVIAKDILQYPAELLGHLRHELSEIMGLPHSFGVAAGGREALISSLRHVIRTGNQELLDAYRRPWEPDAGRGYEYRQQLIQALGLDLREEDQLSQAARLTVEIEKARRDLSKQLSSLTTELVGAAPVGISKQAIRQAPQAPLRALPMRDFAKRLRAPLIALATTLAGATTSFAFGLLPVQDFLLEVQTRFASTIQNMGGTREWLYQNAGQILVAGLIVAIGTAVAVFLDGYRDRIAQVLENPSSFVSVRGIAIAIAFTFVLTNLPTLLPALAPVALIALAGYSASSYFQMKRERPLLPGETGLARIQALNDIHEIPVARGLTKINSPEEKALVERYVEIFLQDLQERLGMRQTGGFFFRGAKKGQTDQLSKEEARSEVLLMIEEFNEQMHIWVRINPQIGRYLAREDGPLLSRLSQIKQWCEDLAPQIDLKREVLAKTEREYEAASAEIKALDSQPPAVAAVAKARGEAARERLAMAQRDLDRAAFLLTFRREMISLLLVKF